MHKRNLLVLAFGEGGHRTQALRLFSRLMDAGLTADDRVICVTDKEGIGLEGHEETSLRPLRTKQGGQLPQAITLAVGLITNAWRCRRIFASCLSAERTVLVSLGPAFVVTPAVLVRLCGGRVVHIETWSRFESRSITGRLMQHVAHHFLVQNESLTGLYKGSIFAGRL